jgi:hypothetical protein
VKNALNSFAYQTVEEELTELYRVESAVTVCRDPKPGLTRRDYIELSKVELQLTAAKKRLTWIYEEKGLTDEEVLAAGEEVDKLLNLYEAIKKKFEV